MNLQNAGTLALAAMMINNAYHTPPVVYKRALPSIVSVQSYQSQIDPFDTTRRKLVQKSLGTGFVLKTSPNIKIMTNFHVIAESHEIHVNGDTVARLVYAEPIQDVAIIEIPSAPQVSHTLTFCKASPEIGQNVVVIGHPFGLEYSLSAGTISGLGRNINDNFNLIQTDAAINPGNSGGPLLTMDGCVAGMVTSIISPSGSSSGVGFAIPASLLAKYT